MLVPFSDAVNAGWIDADLFDILVVRQPQPSRGSAVLEFLAETFAGVLVSHWSKTATDC